ncbi:hypothetical protein V8E53_000943 [Lactarius tabidus]
MRASITAPLPIFQLHLILRIALITAQLFFFPFSLCANHFSDAICFLFPRDRRWRLSSQSLDREGKRRSGRLGSRKSTILRRPVLQWCLCARAKAERVVNRKQEETAQWRVGKAGR